MVYLSVETELLKSRLPVHLNKLRSKPAFYNPFRNLKAMNTRIGLWGLKKKTQWNTIFSKSIYFQPSPPLSISLCFLFVIYLVLDELLSICSFQWFQEFLVTKFSAWRQRCLLFFVFQQCLGVPLWTEILLWKEWYKHIKINSCHIMPLGRKWVEADCL